METIFRLGQETAPKEACGFLVDREAGQWSILELENISDEPTSSYEVEQGDPGELSRDTFFNHTYVWHTHPSGMVGPSKGDLDNMAQQVKYLVMTIPTREVVKYERCQ